MVRKSGGGTLTTFFGVFVPCVLSIFSVVLFLRMGYILGQAGLIVTLVMLSVAYVTTLSALPPPLPFPHPLCCFVDSMTLLGGAPPLSQQYGRDEASYQCVLSQVGGKSYICQGLC